MTSEDRLVVESLPGGGLLVMDAEGGRTHTLNPMAAAVWTAWKDGEREAQALLEAGAAVSREADESTIANALEQLQSAGLIEMAPPAEGLSRRQVMKAAASVGAVAAALLPVVETLATPSPAAAQSKPRIAPP